MRHPSAQDAHTDSAERMLVRFDGRQILDPAGAILAELGNDEHWYTSEGVPCGGLTLPVENARPHVTPADRDAARRRQNSEWIAAAMQAVRQLASRQQHITSDDVWAVIEMPPRESRMIGNVLARAESVGVLEATDEHRPSKRRENHSRPVRVWRSKLYGQQPLV